MAPVREKSELAEFLRTRRGRVDRAHYGLPAASRGKTTGLRREEVAYLSGVSLTWYTWLEQGRDINPSRQVIEAVSAALRLAPTERDYLLTLVGFSTGRGAPALDKDPLPEHMKRLLDSMDDQPAYALAPDWGILGWNRAYQALYPQVARVEPEERNLLWLVFTESSVRALLADWDVTSGRFLAEFRAESGPRLHDPAVRALVAKLAAASPSFRAGWQRHDITGFASREREFRHPQAGRLLFEQHQLRPSDRPDLQVVIYTAADAGVLARLRSILPEAGGELSRNQG